MEKKDSNSFILIAFLILLLYVWNKMLKERTSTVNPRKPNEKCVDPDFKDVIIDISQCRGSYIDENRKLILGDSGCDVIVLQQRLNQIEQVNILQPSGKFDCATLEKLKRVKGVSTISLNDFLEVEQIGLDTLKPSNVHSTQKYMDLN
tara:strand:- start:581 stop:1024 length:444 start_codon:yes stop_codon:yes gene_type:complete